jgi:hypothetical protein
MKAFIKKHREHINLRKPESASLAQSTSYSKFNVQQCFNNLKAVQEKHGSFKPHRIYNVDETGLCTVHVPPKIWPLKALISWAARLLAKEG